MKTLPILLTAFLGTIAVTGVRAENAKPASRIEVNFNEPEKFTDAADGPRGTDYGREGILEDLQAHLVRKASVYVPEGQKLTVTIKDIDLAGEIEPWRSPSLQDVRIVKEIYPPRIDLSFKLVDANGAVIKEGDRQLRDLAFTMNINPNRTDPRVYEKALLDDWLRSEFKAAKKK